MPHEDGMTTPMRALAAALALAGPRLANADVRVDADACAKGDAPACLRAGEAYVMGRGVPADPARAAKLFLLACDAGHAKGCFNAGNATYKGDGVEKDAARATAPRRIRRGP